jgi:high-affinity K+ transport system ATPase subunit B
VVLVEAGDLIPADGLVALTLIFLFVTVTLLPFSRS